MDVRDHEAIDAMVARVVQEWGRVDGCSRWSRGSATMCLLPRRSTATIRPFRCWSLVSAEPGPGDYGCMSAATGRSVVPRRRRRSISTAPTAVARIQRPISRTSRAFCKPMPIAGSWRCTSRGRPAQGSPRYRRSPRSPAGAIAAEESSTCGKDQVDRRQSGARPDRPILRHRGQGPLRRVRRAGAPSRRCIPLLDVFFVWAQDAERKLSARSELAEALRYDRTTKTSGHSLGVSVGYWP